MSNDKQRLLQSLASKGFAVEQYQDLYRVCKDGRCRLLNIRTKQTASYCRRLERHEFGMRATDFDRYKQLAADGETVFVVINESSTGRRYVASVDALVKSARTYRGDKLDTGGTVFLPVSAFRMLAI